MQQIVHRRLRPAALPVIMSGAPPALDRSAPLPTHLLFGTLLGPEGRGIAAPAPERRPGRRRTSVLLFLERVLWPS